MPPLPPHHVPRPRLVSRLAGRRVSTVVAGGGYGKSSLAREAAAAIGAAEVTAALAGPHAGPDAVAAALRRGAGRAGLSAVAAALDEAPPPERLAALVEALARLPDPVVLVVDDVQVATGPAAEWIAALAAGLPAPHRVLVLGRRLPPALAPAGPPLGPGDLALSAEEVAAVLRAAGGAASPARAAEVHRLTGGWPAAVVLAARRGAPAADGFPALVDALLAGLGPVLGGHAVALGHLPMLDAALIGLLAGPDAAGRLEDGGLPLTPGTGGWLELPAPLREDLARRAPADAAVLGVAAAHYARRGEAAAAVALLAGAARPADLAGLLAALDWRALDALSTGEILAALALVPDAALAGDATALVQAARVAEARTQLEVRERLLGRAAGVTGAGGPAEVARAVAAETALDHARDGRAHEAEQAARAVLGDAGPGEGVTRGRALLALGRAAAFRGDPASLSAAEDHYAEAAATLQAMGQAEWRAAALTGLGYGVSFARGDLDRGVAHLREALGALPRAGRHRAALATFLAEALTAVGRLDEAEALLAEAAETGRDIGDHRIRAYAAWEAARVAAVRGDAAGVARRLREAERHASDWFGHPTGVEFLADGAQMLARAGDEAGARAWAARAVERAAAAGHPEIAWPAEGAVEARFGDPRRAEEVLAAYAASPQQPPREEWRTLLLRAHAATRRGGERAAALATDAFEAAAALGHPELPALHEADIAPALAELAGAAGSRAARRAGDRPPDLAVTVLGGFAVTADGRPADPPPGRTATLVKLLAVRAGPVAVDEAVEALWPGVDPVTGRARLRNLLNRIRARCGGLVVRRGDEALALAPGVRVDASEFTAAADAALAAAAPEREGLARLALSRHRGELLPADPYAEWAAAPRERLRRRHLDLVDMLAAGARERGDLDEAVRLLDAGIAAEPMDDGRLVACAELMLALGRRGGAGGLARRARDIRGALGLPPTARLERLLAASGPGGAAPGSVGP